MSMPAPTPPTRSDDEKLALALRIAEGLATSPVRGLKTNVAIQAGGKPGPDPVTVTVTEGDRPAVRDALMDLRLLATREEDVYVPTLHSILLKRKLKRGWGAGFKAARKAWNVAQRPHIQVADPDDPTKPDGSPNWILPRDAWEMWVYGEHIHRNLEHELRAKRMPSLTRGVARALAFDYNAMLLEQADFLGRLIRDGLEQPLP